MIVILLIIYKPIMCVYIYIERYKPTYNVYNIMSNVTMSQGFN